MLRQRVISAAVLIPALICAIWFAPYWLYTAIFGIVILLALYEFYKIVRAIDVRPFIDVGIAVAALLITCSYFNSHAKVDINILPILGAVLALAGFVVNYLYRSDGRYSAARWLWTIAGVIYVGWLGSHFIALRAHDGWDA